MAMEGMRGEKPVSAPCRWEGIHSTVYCRWLEEFLEAGKQRPRGDALRGTGRDEVQALKDEYERPKQLVARAAPALEARCRPCGHAPMARRVPPIGSSGRI